MKTKFYWFALFASAALIAQAQAGGNHGGGGGGMGGGNFAGGGHPAPAGGGRAFSSFHSAPMRNFGGGRMIYSGQRFSAAGLRSPSSAAFSQSYVRANRGAPLEARHFAPGNINRSDRLARTSSEGNRAVTSARREGNGAGQIRHGNGVPANWRNHVVAQHSANWHRDWARNRDHWWHGHHCRFINGSWVIFDFGFDPWWPYWYPYDYYASNYYPYGAYGAGDYDPGVYQGEEDYDQNGYADQYADSTLATAQERLAQQGYYRGEIDGVFGPETGRAIARYQSNHGLRVTGSLTTDTLQALGLRRVASN